MTKVEKVDGGYEVKVDGEDSFFLFPYKQDISTTIHEVRIQMIEGIRSIYGFSFLRVSYFREGEQSEYRAPKTNFVNVSLSARETAQKYIKETRKEIGLADLTKWPNDLGAHLSFDLSTEYFNEIYELVKTRQLTSLAFSINLDDEEKTVFQEYRKRSKFGDDLFPRSIATYSVDLDGASGSVETINFASEPLELNQQVWGENSVTPLGFDKDFDTYEAYIKRKGKTLSWWNSFSMFQKTLLALLFFIAISVFVIRWSI